MKNKEFWGTGGKILLIIALVIGSTSLVMNLTSIALEKKYDESYATTAVPSEEVHIIKVLAAGDADYGTAKNIGEDQSQVFSLIQQTVANYDIACYQQKTLVGTEVDSTFADAAISTGFNLVSLASEHSLSAGKEGIDASMAYWDAQDVLISGTNLSTDEQNQLKTMNIDGVNIIFLSVTDVLDDEVPESEQYLINRYEETQTAETVKKAAGLADIVIVSIDWQGENLSMPSEHQQAVAKELADAGASVIIGHAANAVQPVAWIEDTLIFYSAGNLVSDSTDNQQRLGIMGAVDITITSSREKKKVELTNPRVELVGSVSTGSGYQVRLFSDITSTEFPGKDAVASEYESVLLQMDDSIRIGGLQ